MPQLIDYSAGHIRARAVAAAGYVGVCRYLSTPGNPKNLTPQEAVDLSDHFLLIVTAFETTADRALAGYTAGLADGVAAAAQAEACGAPKDCVLYAAVDFAATVKRFGAQAGTSEFEASFLASPVLQQIGHYFSGWRDGLGRHRPGAYGDAAVIDFLFGQGLITHGWQTVAWSGGRRSAHACILQLAQQVTVAGVECDVNVVLMPDYGGWMVSNAPAPPGPAPTPREEDMAGAAIVNVPVGEEVTIPVPPPHAGGVNGKGYGAVYVSFSRDFSPDPTRIALGAGPKTWRWAPGADADGYLPVPVGRKLVVALEAGDEIVSVRNDRSQHPVGVLVEWEYA